MSAAEQSQPQSKEAWVLARQPIPIIRNGRVVGQRWPDIHFGTLPRENTQRRPQQAIAS